MSIFDTRAEGFELAKGEGWIFVVLLLGIVAIGESLKAYRLLALLPIVIVAVVYARETVLRKQNLPLLAFTALGFVYVVLSYLHVFPTAWTRYHDTSVIPQQASFLAILLPMVAASQKWWEDSRFDLNRDAVLIAVVLVAFVLGSAVDLVLLGGTSFRGSYTLRNYVFLGLLALSYLAFRPGRWRPTAIFVLLLVAAWCVAHNYFLQNTIVYLTILGFLATTIVRIPADRLILSVFLVLLATATIVGLQDPARVFEIDSNSGWRLAFWKDALEASAQTWGVGVGFGTESLRNEYSALLDRANYREEAEDFLLVSTHSAFIDTVYRLGVIGVGLLIIILARCFPHRNMPLSARAQCCAMFAMLVLCLHSNLGLQSPMYSLGVAICIGYLQSERRKALAATSVTLGGVPAAPAGMASYTTPLPRQ
jgi:hypothetical protein